MMPATTPLFDNQEKPKGLFTKAALADYLAVSTKTVERELKRGMPSLVVGGHRRFDLVEVMRWLKQRRSKHG